MGRQLTPLKGFREVVVQFRLNDGFKHEIDFETNHTPGGDVLRCAIGMLEDCLELYPDYPQVETLMQRLVSMQVIHDPLADLEADPQDSPDRGPRAADS